MAKGGLVRRRLPVPSAGGYQVLVMRRRVKFAVDDYQPVEGHGNPEDGLKKSGGKNS